ncbi:MAG: hypothetical protein AVDCRST_MAG02-906 [uncultured Rubrobacteraceae bacterium]|uniref:DUF4331 domain-containing protein n=1 Tax=uncultured Rubrobacteraceae bacterium TaxID=349277 RepID=A0A6J4QUG1_9ACTN|nr:MAG: hypothetical protein AVDCRST_MAG02-906 [uncultured Rubrobacteraceae bacterium]
MPDHIDSPSALPDGRLDLCDMYAFGGEEPRTTALVFTVNPDAGKSSPTTFHPGALYEIKLDTDGDAVEDVTYRVTFGDPDASDTQTLAVRRAGGDAARNPRSEGELLGEGRTGETVPLSGGGRAWAGAAADPFFGDGIALGRFRNAALEGRYDPEAFAQGPVDVFAGRNVTGVALELPTAPLGSETFSLWGVTLAPREGGWVRVDRWATPLIQHLFINHDPHLADEYSKARPEDDLEAYAGRISGFVEKLTTAAGTAQDPAAYGRHVAALLLPDVLTYDTREPASYGTGGRNGRAMADDVYDVMVSLAANASLADGVSSGGNHLPGFPYLAPPKDVSPDLPPLATREAGREPGMRAAGGETSLGW